MNNYMLLLFAVLSTCTVSLKPEINVVVDDIAVGFPKNYTINNTREFLISVTNLGHDFAKIPPRFYVECFNCNKLSPAIVIFKQERGVSSFPLPIVLKLMNEQEALFNYTERTLCPYESYHSNANKISEESVSNITYNNNNNNNGVDNTLIISLSTSNKENVTLSLNVTTVVDFVLELNVNKTVTLTPSKPALYFYEFSNGSNGMSVVLKVESEASHCMIMSIQNKSCPLHEVGSVLQNGYFQTVTFLGAMTVTRDKFPLGFYVYFSLGADDSHCSSDMMSGERSKTFILSITKAASTQHYVYVILGTFFVILIFYAIMCILICFSFMREDILLPNLETHFSTESCEPSTSTPVQQLIDDRIPSTPYIFSPTADTRSIKTDSSLDETDVDTLTDVEEDKNIFRTKITLCLSDLAKKNPTVLKKKSQLYIWNLATVSVFYGLPAYQLVLTYQNNLLESGNEDLCYYNFLCSHPLGPLYDFNHVFSNIGYVALGILFLIITCRKECVHNKLLAQNKLLDRLYGVPQHFGLYYAMGTSLIIEGLLSACYHICPNLYNFQFDVSFMYIISTLCMVKIYQSRHPDVNATAYSTFSLIALILFFDIWGLFTKSYLFWTITTAVHIGTIFYLSLHIYYVGRFSFDGKAIILYLKYFRFEVCVTSHFWRPMYSTRFILIAVINICNWCLAASPFLLDAKNFSLHLLLIFIANLVLYTTFYMIMKLVSKEKILLQPCIYIVLAVVSWSVALYYFYNKTITWRKTPAESRIYNKPCELFDFYDKHDIWHFLSSAGLFFSFLVLLTLDDDLYFVERCKIPVF